MFSDYPAMIPVVRCESDFMQYWPNGNPKISTTDDVGIMQINIPTWSKKAKAMGLDIYNNVDDNIKMGRYILKVQGITAWNCYK